jgi:RHS repeat-associated protein
MTSKYFDFKGNPLVMTRRLSKIYDQRINWDNNPAGLELETFQTESTYDALNRPMSTTLPDGTLLEYTYNKGGYLENLQAQIMGQGSFKNFLTSQNHDAKGQKQWVKYGNETITKYFYEAKTFRLSNLITVDKNNKALQDLHYKYDPLGNIMEVRDDAQDTLYYNNGVISPQKQYEYDHLNRLTSATGREHAGTGAMIPSNEAFAHLQGLPHQHIQNAVREYTQTYEYDAVDNITSMAHRTGQAIGNWTRAYTYTSDATNKLRSTQIGSNPTSNYQDYDIHGNMTKMPHLEALTWNFADQLSVVEINANGYNAYYNYDGGGQRIRKVIKNGSTKKVRLYLGGVECYRVYSGNTLQEETWTLQVDGIAQVDTKTVDNTLVVPNPTPLIRYQYSDHLGSATMETNENGQLISYEEYHPYGTTAYSTYVNGSYSTKRYRFTNKERDDETGLYYFGVRYYAAWLGRWTSSDPGDFVDGLNLYRYVRNNPVNLTDPDGMSPDDGDPLKNGTPLLNKNNELVGYKLGDGQGFTHVAAHLNNPETQKEYGYTLEKPISWTSIALQADNASKYVAPELEQGNITLPEILNPYHDAWKTMNMNEGERLVIDLSGNSVIKVVPLDPSDPTPPSTPLGPINSSDGDGVDKVGWLKTLFKIGGTVGTVQIARNIAANNSLIATTQAAGKASLEAYNFSKTAEGATRFMVEHGGEAKMWSNAFYGNQHVSNSFVETAKSSHAASVAKGLQTEQTISNATQSISKASQVGKVLRFGGLAVGGGLTIYQYATDDNYGFKNIVPDNEYNKEIALGTDLTMVGVGAYFPIGTGVSLVYFIGIRPFM